MGLVSLQVGGAAVMAVGIWTLVEKSGYLSILASSTFAASAYILIFVGGLVMTTGFLGFGAVIREQKSCLSTVSVPPPPSLCGNCLPCEYPSLESECRPVPSGGREASHMSPR